MLEQQIKEDVEATAAEVFEFLSLRADRAFIDTRECLQQFSSPLVDVPKGNIALERMNDSLNEVNALLRVRHCGVEHFALPHLTFFAIVDFYLIYVLLYGLQLLRCDGQPGFVDRASDVMDQSRVLGRF